MINPGIIGAASLANMLSTISPGRRIFCAGDSWAETSISSDPAGFYITAASAVADLVTLTFHIAHGITVGNTAFYTVEGLDSAYNKPNGVTITATTTMQVTYAATGAGTGSSTALGYASKQSTRYIRSMRPLGWGVQGAEGRVTVFPRGYGTGGKNTTTYLSDVKFTNLKADLTAEGGGIVVIMLGTNDSSGGFSLATTQANVDQIITEIMACAPAGCIKIFWCNEGPRTGVASDALHIQRVQWLASLGSLYDNVYGVDTFSVLAVGGNTNVWLTGYDNSDGTHVSQTGAKAAGAVLATAIMNEVPTSAFTQLYSENATGVLNSNPAMTGSGGTGDAEWAGTVPANWVCSGTSGDNGFTCTLSDETRHGIAGKKITLSGQSTTAHPDLFMYQVIATAGLTVGDDLFVCGLIEYENLVNIRMVGLELNSQGVSVKARSLENNADTANDILSGDVTTLRRDRTLNIRYLTGVTSFRAGIQIQPAAANTAISGTIWVAQITARLYDDTLALPVAA